MAFLVRAGGRLAGLSSFLLPSAMSISPFLGLPTLVRAPYVPVQFVGGGAVVGGNKESAIKRAAFLALVGLAAAIFALTAALFVDAAFPLAG
jgi:hypothetical protein